MPSNNLPNPCLDSLDSSLISRLSSYSSSSDSNSNSDSPSTRNHQNTMRDTDKQRLRTKHERIFTNMDPFTQSLPKRREQEEAVSPKTVPSKDVDHGPFSEKGNAESKARKGSKRAHNVNDGDDDGPLHACQETRRGAAAADSTTTVALADSVDSGKEGAGGGRVTASVNGGMLRIAGLRTAGRTQVSDAGKGRKDALTASVEAGIMTMAGLKTAWQT